MDWNKGFSARYYGTFVDPVTWRDIDRFEITGGSISKTESDKMQSADVDCTEYPTGEHWIRLHLVAKQNDSSVHDALFTGLACSPEDNFDGYRNNKAVQAYSVLKPAEDVLLERGWYAPADADAARLMVKLLSVTPAPKMIDGDSPRLKQAIIAEDGETRLSMTHKILDAIGWRMRISGDGTITFCPKATESLATFDPLYADSIEPKVTVKNDWYDCPNVYRAAADDLTAIARDESDDSMLSIQNRGREIWKEDNSVSLGDSESIADYALRKLREEQQHYITVSYDRRYIPDVMVSDLITLNYPAQRVVGTYMIQSQTIELGYSARTSEEVVKYEY